jgi:hypothetical protein
MGNMTYLGNHTAAVQRGINMGVALFIVSEALFFLAIFWAFFHKKCNLWLETKLRGSPKALITKLFKETFKVASLMTEGIVTSLEILAIGMGDRGSKSDSHISVKEQRVDGFSVFYNRYCKVYSKCQGNLVYMYNKKYIHSSAISQQNKLSSKFTTISKLNPHYVTGFTDGEGCFFIGVNPESKHKTGYRIKASFQIGLHEKDLALLKEIKLFFGVGNISKLGQESVQFRVSGLEDLKIILCHFDKYPLLTNKHYDYLLFKQVVNLMVEGKHLTLDGLNKIISIKAVLNNQEISDNLNKAFPNIEPVLRPEIKNREIQNLHWLAGFTDAEGCLRFILTQHTSFVRGQACLDSSKRGRRPRDEVFLKSLISTLNCGRYIPKSGYGEFVVEKFTDVRDKIIPIFEKFKLHGIKAKNYEDFKKAALLMDKKAHLTREGLDEIKKIKGRMNKNRD